MRDGVSEACGMGGVKGEVVGKVEGGQWEISRPDGESPGFLGNLPATNCKKTIWGISRPQVLRFLAYLSNYGFLLLYLATLVFSVVVCKQMARRFPSPNFYILYFAVNHHPTDFL